MYHKSFPLQYTYSTKLFKITELRKKQLNIKNLHHGLKEFLILIDCCNNLSQLAFEKWRLKE